MQTQAGDPGAFADFDLGRVPSPCFVIDEAKLDANLVVLADVAERSGASMFAALKAFAMWALAPNVSRALSGTCSSGLWEARLARSHYAGTVITYAAAFRPSEIDEILDLSDHIIFNTPRQHDRFRSNIESARERGRTISVGLRINPEHSEVETPRYDPAAPGSRLGTPISQLDASDLDDVDGLHMHTLCEQGVEPLQRTWHAIRKPLSSLVGGLQWINLGGGHHITRHDYDRDALVELIDEIRGETGCDVHLEPGEAVALDAGILVGEVLDVMTNGGDNAILDISATCHMPDVLEAPYRPALLGEGGATQVRLGGPSCLAGDVVGTYAFPGVPAVGQRLAFLDQAHYSMVKTTTFNGIALPAIAIWNSLTDELRIVREFTDDQYRQRLS